MLKRTAMLLALGLALFAPGHLSAGPALVFEANSGLVLYAEDPDHQWHPASVTKMMTAYLTFEAIKAGKLKLNDKIICSVNAHAQVPSKIGLPVGAKMSVRLALQVLIVKSANDVAVMLSEAVGGTEAAFVARMNAKAAKLGMTRTHFANPHGLPDARQVTTARDLARLARRLIKDFPEYAYLFSQRSVKVGRRRLGTHNGLLKTFAGADGLKTGFICDAGYNVVASATRNGTRIVAVVLGARTGAARRVRATSLLEHGFKTYDWKTALFSTVSIDTLDRDLQLRPAVSLRKKVCRGNISRSKSRSKKRRRKAKNRKRSKSAAARRKVANLKRSKASARRKPRTTKAARTKTKTKKAR